MQSGDVKAQMVLRNFRMVFNAVKSHFQQVEKLAGIGGAQVWALSAIAANPGLGVGALSAEMDIHQSTASNLVKGLVAQALVSALRNGVDKRSVQLHVTKKGRAVLRKVPGPFVGVLPDALNKLDFETLLRLETDLAALLAHLGADTKAARKPLAHL